MKNYYMSVSLAKNIKKQFYKNKIIQKSVMKFKFLAKSIFLITVLALLGCSSPDSRGVVDTGGGSGENNAPDLVVSVSTQSDVIVGKTITLSATITNSGTIASSSTTVRFYKSNDEIISTEDDQITINKVNRLAVNSSEPVIVGVLIDYNIGTRYYGACVVAVSGETSTGNNCSAGSKVIVKGEPDLAVSFTANPAVVAFDGTITLSATVTNSGTLSANNQTTLRFYSSDDDVISRSDTLIKAFTIPKLAADSSSSKTLSIDAHNSGNRYYGGCVVVDPDETNTTNNCSTGAVVTIGNPDLVVSLTANSTAIVPGESVTLSATVTNIGTIDSSSTTLRYYKSDDEIISESDSKIGDDVAIGGLSTNSNSPKLLSITAINTGTRYYGACVVAVSDETSTDNNCSTGFAVNVGNPDLVVSVTANPTVVASGDAITLSATVTNSGTIASNLTTLRFYSSDDDVISLSDTLIKAVTVPNLPVDSSSSETLSTDSHNSGNRYYGACVIVDPNEANTTNNCSAGVVVTIGNPDLVVSATASPAAVATGDTITLSATVTNSGIITSSSTTLRYYKSDDEIISKSDNKIGDDVAIGVLATNSSSSTKTLSITADSTGTRYYGACVVAVSDETSTDNNCSTGFAVNVGNPDLVVSVIANPTVVASGDTITLSATVTNSGIIASNLTNLYYYKSDDEIISESDSLIETDTINSLPADSSSTSTAMVIRKGAVTEFYGACVADVHREVKKDNNCSTAASVFEFTNVANVDDIGNYLLNGASSVSIAQIGNATYLFVAGYIDDGVSVFRVADGGTLTNVANVDDSDYLLNGARSVSTAQIGNNTYLFVAGFDDNGVSVFNVDSSGDLRNVANVTDNDDYKLGGASSVSTAQIGNNTYLFVAGQGEDDGDGVSVFNVDSSGDLRNVVNVTDNNDYQLDGARSVSTAQIGSATYLFVAGQSDNGVSVFNVDSSGDLRNVANVTDNGDYKLGGASSVSIAQIGSATYLFVAGQSDNGVSVFNVDSSGDLRNVANVDSDNNNYNLLGAESVSTAQIGNVTYLFVAAFQDNGVSVFRVADDGTLTNVVNVANSNKYELFGATSVSTAQIGNATYLFVAGLLDNGVSVFQMNGPTNHTFATALNIKKGQSYSGNISNGNNNYYRIYLRAGDHTFETSGNLGTSCNIYSSNNTNSLLTSDDNSGTDNSCQINYLISTSGYYYLRISASGSGIYTVVAQ